MKKIFLVGLAFIFVACGTNRDEYATTEPPEITEILEMLESEREPDETPPPGNGAGDHPESYYTFESGFLGLKFRLPSLSWNFETINRASRNTALVWHSDWPVIDGNQIPIIFEIGLDIDHPRYWQTDFWAEPFPGGRWNWVHPREYDEVFTTAHGLTVVQYSQTAPLWREPGEHSPDYTTTMFIFRRDGRDYREVAERSALITAMLHVPADLHEHFYPDARAAMDGFEFLPGAEIRHQPTPVAEGIDITAANFPKIDGSTSTLPLTREIMTAMFSAEYTQFDWGTTEYHRYQPWQASRTVPSYELLLGGEVDIILVPEPSAHVLGLAEAAGVALEFTPVAAEALIFITAVNNPVTEITREQVLQIYTDMSITNWEEIGGYYGRIVPLNRNPHSGSQTLMDNLVLRGERIHAELERYAIDAMRDMISDTENLHLWWSYDGEPVQPYNFGLGYTVYFFLREIWDSEREWREEWLAAGGDAEREPMGTAVKPLAFDGVFPSRETIISGEYPLATRYYAVIRADAPQDAPARRLIAWLLTPDGQDAVERAGIGRLHQ